MCRLRNYLLLSIFNTPENYLSNVDRKSEMRKVSTYSVKLSSSSFSCSMCAIYNRANRAKKYFLVLNSYLPGINK